MANNLTPPERWNDLRAYILKEIRAIDKDTPWNSAEPKWWLEMSELERFILDQKDPKIEWNRNIK